MAVAQWRQMRLWAHEKNTIAEGVEKRREIDPLADPRTSASAILCALAATGLTRHEMSFDRQFTRSLKSLAFLKLQARTQQAIDSKENPKK